MAFKLHKSIEIALSYQNLKIRKLTKNWKGLVGVPLFGSTIVILVS